jgi:hypothetical protein
MARARLCALIAAMLTAAMSASLARAATADDRYGPPGPVTIDKSHPLSLLSWPGKPQASTTPAPAQPAQSSVATPAPASPPVRAALPTSLYSPSPQAQAAAAGQPPRRYSVDREFGVQPDPIPLPEPFFANSPQVDLAEPPPPPPAKTANGANTVQARNAAANANDGQAASTLDSFGSN